MSDQRTRAQLRASIRRRSHKENATNYIQDTTINEYINESIKELMDFIIDAGGEDWFKRTDTIDISIPTTPDLGQWVLPSSFYRMLGVRLDGIPLKRFQRYDRGAYTDGLRHRPSDVRYRLGGQVDTVGPPIGTRDNTIELIPNTISSGILTIEYIPTAPTLTADTDVWDGFNGWYEYVIVDCVIKILEEEDKDTTRFENRLARVRERILRASNSLDMGMPDTVVDVDDDDDYYGGLYF